MESESSETFNQGGNIESESSETFNRGGNMESETCDSSNRLRYWSRKLPRPSRNLESGVGNFRDLRATWRVESESSDSAFFVRNME